MRRLNSAYNLLVTGLFAFAGVYVVAICITIIWDVTARNLGFHAPSWLGLFSAYGLLIIVMSAAPFLVRHRGHVAMDILLELVPKSWDAGWLRGTDAICALICAVFAYYSVLAGYDSLLRGEIDVQAINIPRWLPYAIMTGGFILCCIEFARHLLFSKGASKEDAHAAHTQDSL